MSEEEKQVADACDALLATIIARSEPHLRRASETLYDQLLSGVQTYLVENAHWNLGNEIRRCAEINRRNAELVETTHRLELQQQRLLAALKNLAFRAMTSGGTANHDELLVAAVDQAVAAIAKAETPND
jgi:hypothetical protein